VGVQAEEKMTALRDRWTAALAAAAIALLAAGPALAFDPFLKENGDVADGNAALSKGQTKEALAAYDDAARSLPGRAEVHLDRGLALLRAGDDKLDQAMQALTLAAGPDAPAKVRARALANLGDAFFKKEDFEAAIEQYKKSLMLAPGSRATAWNLEVAKQKQQKKEEQQKKDQQKQDQQKQDQQKQDQQKQDQQKQDQQKQDQQKQDQQKQDQEKQDQQKQDQQKQDQQKQQPQANRPKTQQEMEQMLDALDRDQKSLAEQQARKRAVAMPAAPLKDW
jgi:Ca-activated chloride channel family protein